LTRMQPQAYWYTNHLLMRIKYDNKQEMEFVKGNLDKQKAWETLKGALEIQGETMILTSLPLDKGLLRLKNSTAFADMNLSVRLKGNKLGLQKVYLRADENLGRFLSVNIYNNILSVTEKTNGAEKKLFQLNLDQHDGKESISIPEDQKDAQMKELETFAKYSDSVELAKDYAEQLKNKNLENPPKVSDGAEAYVPELSVNAKGDRLLTLSLKGDHLSVMIDGKIAVTDLQTADMQAGSVYLETAWGSYGWSQRNLADDVYDGVFDRLIITENTGLEKDKEKILFDSRPQGLEAVKLKMKQWWEAILNWSILYL